MKKVRILTIDGGGIRGVIPATVLTYVEHKLQVITGNSNARLADYFDFLAGTSTGGILSCFYLIPNPIPDGPSVKNEAKVALDFYVKEGYSIFNGSKHRFQNMRMLFNATAYRCANLENIFLQEFGNTKFSELYRPCMVPTYNMESSSSFFFFSREEEEKQRDFYVRDVTRSTSAAPTYFPPAIIRNLITGDQMTNLDGGVFANNPSMCAYAEAREFDFPERASKPTADDLLVLSLGAGGGQVHFSNPPASRNWGVLKWASNMPVIMMDGSSDTVNFQMKKLFEALPEERCKNYKRVDVPPGAFLFSSDMADASPENIEKLQVAGEAALKAAQEGNQHEHSLDDFIQLLVDNA